MAALADYDALWRYFHILAGITWIGLLYFFNLVNLPLLKFDMKKPFDVEMTEKASMHITLKTLWWFRWGAAFTVLFGLLLIESQRWEHGGLAPYFLERGFAGYFILVGVVFGLIMAYNVWFIIWPNQQVIMKNNKAIAATSDEEETKRLQAENAPRAKTAVLASRMNTWLSVPMLFGMIMGAHGFEGNLGDSVEAQVMTGVLIVLLAVMYFMSTSKSKA